MARHDPKRSRVTPKGTQATPPKGDDVYRAPRPTGDDGVPTPMAGPSPTWVPVMMFGLLGIGVLMILLNYLSVLPGAPTNWYLLGGLGFVLGGIFTATQYR